MMTLIFWVVVFFTVKAILKSLSGGGSSPRNEIVFTIPSRIPSYLFPGEQFNGISNAHSEYIEIKKGYIKYIKDCDDGQDGNSFIAGTIIWDKNYVEEVLLKKYEQENFKPIPSYDVPGSTIADFYVSSIDFKKILNVLENTNKDCAKIKGDSFAKEVILVLKDFAIDNFTFKAGMKITLKQA